VARHKNRVKTQRARKKAMTRNKNRVLEIENDGEYIDVQFVRNNGEVVIGIFKRVGWAEGLTCRIHHGSVNFRGVKEFETPAAWIRGTHLGRSF